MKWFLRVLFVLVVTSASFSFAQDLGAHVTSVTVDKGSIVGGSIQYVTATITMTKPVDLLSGAAISVDGDIECEYPSWYAFVCWVPRGTNSTTVKIWGKFTVDGYNTQVWASTFNDPDVGSRASLSVTPNPLSVTASSFMTSGEQGGSGTVRLAVAPRSAMNVDFSQTPPPGVGAPLNLPWSAQIPAGATSADFSFSANPVTKQTDVTLNADNYGVKASTNVTVSASAKDPDQGGSDCATNAQSGSGSTASPGACDVGGPINLANGNTWIHRQDYSSPGLGGVAVGRTWNSLRASSSPPAVAGMFGDSWTTNYEERLLFLGDTNNLKYWKGGGGAWLFTYKNDRWTLVSPANATATLVSDATNTFFTMTFQDASKKVFTNSGLLTTIIDQNGNATGLAYDASNRLSQVTSPGGKWLRFNYAGPNKQVASIQDAVGVIATYTYDGSARLTSATYADGSSNSYNYNSASLLTSVVDHDGKILEAHTYDGNRRGLTSVRANGVDQVTLSYLTPSSTRVTDSKGNVTDYTFITIAGRSYITSSNGSGCSSCGTRGITTYTYDGYGNKTSMTDALGNLTTYSHDGNGNMTSKSIAAPAAR